MMTQPSNSKLFCCTACYKRIGNAKSLQCSICKQSRHLKCTVLSSVDVDVICPICISDLFPFSQIDCDVDFYSSISSQTNETLIDHNLLNELKLQFKCDFTTTFLTPEEDLDADTNYYNLLLNNPVNYYETTKLNPQTPTPALSIPQFFMHVNARSLSKNISNLTTELSLLANKPSIIAVSETWATSDNDNFPIEGYSCVMKSRKNKVGGGVALYIQNKIELKYKIRSDLNIDHISDSLFIQVTNDKLKNIIIGVIYKPPDVDVQKFTENLEQTLKIITKERRPSYLMGDYNINLLKHNAHQPTKNFLDTLLTYGFYPLINKPTRITSQTVTLIDNILTNVHDPQNKSGIWVVDISDHLPVFTILPNFAIKNKIKKKISNRIFSQENLAKFKYELQTHDWSVLDTLPDINSMYAKFNNDFQYLYHESFPVQTKILTASEISKPWITKAIKKSIAKKHKLYKNYQQLRTDESLSKYKTYKNKLTTILRKAEKMYYLEKLNSVRNNLAKTWKILNSVISRTKTKGIIDEIVHNNKVIQDPTIIANNFNAFFANVGPNLAAKIPKSSQPFTKYLDSNISDSIFFKPTNEQEIKLIIDSLKSSFSKGHDNYSVNTLKHCVNELSSPLCVIFNRSMQDGVVPDDLKIAKIVPIYKSDDKKTISNYRPISVLPAFSKILERLIYNRLLDFINKHEILSKNQYGFRQNISTSMALIDLVDQISTSMENNEFTLGIFLDLAKAFDTVNHDILLEKMSHYGIRGLPHNWFKSYLTNRCQYVYLNGINSNKLPVTCGIPQGSILGPLLFLLYINDLNSVSKLLTFIMFADDTNLFIKGRNLDRLIAVLNSELEVITDWFCANLLSLNIKKTNYILFGNKKVCDVSIFINHEKIDRVYETKFLGIIIQANLKWNIHISTIKNKISKSLGIINKAKYILTSSHLKLLYQTLIEPYLNYCCVIWASTVKNTALETLHLLQKRSVRLISYAKARAHAKPLFHKLNILNIYDLCRLQISLFVFKSINCLLPSRYFNYFTLTKEIYHYSTRSSKDCKLFIVNARLASRINTLASRGPKCWNSLPTAIRSSSSQYTFKASVKKYLLSQYLDS